MITVNQFITGYTGWSKDIDGAAGVQCVDLAKEHFRLAGVPNYADAIGGDGYADNIWYHRVRWLTWYKEVQKSEGFKDGDMVIFPHKDRGGWTHPFSHVCFYYQGKEFGTNQGQKPACLKDTDWSDALGALRLREWCGEALPYGYSELIRNGISARIYRGNSAAGYGLHVLSADGSTDLKDITEFDTNKGIKAAVSNAGYFQMEDNQADPKGTHYGVEQDAAAGNSYTQAPKQSGILAFYETKDGVCDFCNADQYFGNPEDVNFAITPYAVRIHDGKKVFGRSVNFGDKDDIKNTQTAAVKFDNGDWALAVFPEQIYPRDTVSFFDNFAGVKELILMDSGGSSQLLTWDNEEKVMRKRLYTERKLPNVFAIAKLKDASFEPDPEDLVPKEEPIIVPVIDPEIKNDETEGENMKEKEPEIQIVDNPNWKDPDEINPELNPGRVILLNIANLFKVKSILTFAIVGTYLALLFIPREIPHFLETLVTMVAGMYFGSQINKSGGDNHG